MNKSTTAKKPIQIFRDRYGGSSDELKEHQKKTRRIQRSILDLLSGSPMTIPQLTEKIDEPSETIFFFTIALKREGKIIEVDTTGDYWVYGLIKEAL
ncbi:MAG: hypothetical protein ACTSYA_08710 [Candidatus Kariarchaeaceae archaeon]